MSHTTNKVKTPAASTRILAAPTTASDVCLGMILQVARKYMFADVRVKVLAYLVIILILSFIADFLITLPTDFYLVQKHNIFNKYGTKLGWFWTCLFTIPFILLTSLLHHGSRTNALRDLVRMIVATLIWSYSRCHGAEHAERHTCSSEGGKWIPGFDISGHTFLLLYSILVMCEEASSFRYWPSTPNSNARRNPGNREEYEYFQKCTNYIQYFFVAMFFLHLLWV